MNMCLVILMMLVTLATPAPTVSTPPIQAQEYIIELSGGQEIRIFAQTHDVMNTCFDESLVLYRDSEPLAVFPLSSGTTWRMR